MNMFRTYQAPENAQPTAKGGIMFERNRGNSSQLATYISNATKFPGSLRSAHIRGQRTQAVPKCQRIFDDPGVVQEPSRNKPHRIRFRLISNGFRLLFQANWRT